MELVLYDAMCRAIDAAHAVDEVKDMRDKAMALQVYARQATNTEAERRAAEIRIRAEKRAGELLSAITLAKGAAEPGTHRGTTPSENMRASSPTLASLGITHQQSSDWQRLAKIPKEQFEAALGDPARIPSTHALLHEAAAPKAPAVSASALWLWGRLLDFERDGLLTAEPSAVLLTMTPEMLDDVHRLAPQVSKWLRLIGGIDDKRTEAA